VQSKIERLALNIGRQPGIQYLSEDSAGEDLGSSFDYVIPPWISRDIQDSF